MRVKGEYVYFSASRRSKACDFYRTRDVLKGPYERLEGSFPFWDPNLFFDDDGRVYFYWGCDSLNPIWGVELDPETMHPMGERRVLIAGDPFSLGYERRGEDHTIRPLREEEIEAEFADEVRKRGMDTAFMPPEMVQAAKGYLSQRPYIEGAWMTKHEGRYYLQYASPGAEYNVYCDSTYVGDSPLGPFTLAVNAPYSYKPGGFLPGAGHGSTMEDEKGNWWHTATMRISVNHVFERRVGLWPAGFDGEGELFCDQRYGDWPMRENAVPWQKPDWMLLSYGKKTISSSSEEGRGPECAADENVQTWWRAADNAPGQWLQMDLGHCCSVHAVQVNFADDRIDIPVPGPLGGDASQPRYIDPRQHRTRWLLEASLDGKDWSVFCDKREARTNLPHDLVVAEEGVQMRYLRLTVYETPYGQPACISGLRVFGIGAGKPPAAPLYRAERIGDLDMHVAVEMSDAAAEMSDAAGYNILWGHGPDKLYHSCMIFGQKEKRIGALVKGRDYYVRVDAFNEAGITEGSVRKL